jgi:crotonobetainyl-CoA:carnitine CoA-transferase CaiB-like acyl-CoA transferase
MSNEAPLRGIRVLEFGQMIAVPAATHVLAAYGAEVIKVEDTGAGDGLRYYGSQKNGMSGWFANANWGKRSIALDMKSADGADVLWSLIETADVFIEGYRTGVMERLGFGYEAVAARNANIIYCSSSGYGATGPYADQPVYDPLIQGLTGWAGMQKQDGKPTLVRAMIADKIGAMTNAQAIMAALIRRGVTGEGSRVQVSMLEANLAFVWPDVMMDCTLLDDDVHHLPNVLASYRLYTCADGLVAIAPGADRHWQSMCEALGPEYYDDERFHTFAGRGEYNREWMDTIDQMVASYPVDEVVMRLRRAEVPVAPVLDPHDVYLDAQISATGLLKESDHPVTGRIRHPRPASAFFGVADDLAPAPLQGEHSLEILNELGVDDDRAARLVAQHTVKIPS